MTVIDARTIPHGRRLEGQVCIAGSGAAGLTLALTLGRAGVDVLVLEAGGEKSEAGTLDASRGVLAAGTIHDPLELIRQRRLGGTSTQWGGRCAPLDPWDFQERPAVEHSGWPVGRADLEPFYRRAHDTLRLGAWEYGLRDAVPNAAAPFDVPQGADLLDDELWRWSPPVSFWRDFGGELRAMPHVRVLHHATLATLRRDIVSGRVPEAQVLTGEGRSFVVEARQFALAVGGLESARILLNSDQDSPVGLGNEHDLVGRYYMTHPVAEVGDLRLTDPSSAARSGYRVTRDGVYCRTMLKLDGRRQRREGLLSLAAALWYPDPRDPAHGDALLSAFAVARFGLAKARVDWKSTAMHRRYGEAMAIEPHLRNIVGGMPELVHFGIDWVRRRWMAERRLPSFMRQPASGRHRLRFDAEQTPDPINRVTLSDQRDVFGMRRLDLSYRVSSSDRYNYARSLELIGDELARASAGRLELPRDPEWPLALHFGDGTHQMGVTRMADTSDRGVVDRECRVHGCSNLSIVSSAVFPTGGCVGPTLTIVALAARAADRLLDEIRHSPSLPTPPPEA